MGKFILTSIGLNRNTLMQEETLGTHSVSVTLTIKLEYIGLGDTTNLTNEDIKAKLQNLLGEEI